VDWCLRIGPFGETREEVHLQGTERDRRRSVLEIEHISFTGAMLGEPRSVKEISGYVHLFPWGPHSETLEKFQLSRLELAHIPGILRDG
jgi:hypothetical protein